MFTQSLYRSTAIVAVSTLLAAGLGGCKNDTPAATAANDASFSTDASMAMIDGPAQPDPVAPAVQAMPAAPKVRYVPVAQPTQSYQYIETADQVNDAFGDAPPDYSFNYGGEHPWVWRTSSDAYRVVEPAPDGERYYFYQPGAQEPYLVRDSSYSYAYSDGQLVNVYDSRGHALARAEAERRADWAARYYARARALRAAAVQDHRDRIIAANWEQRQVRINRDRQDWARDQQQNTQWRDYHTRYGAEQAKRLEAEKQHREQQAVDYHNWQVRQHAVATRPDPRPDPRQDSRQNSQQDPLKVQAQREQARQAQVHNVALARNRAILAENHQKVVANQLKLDKKRAEKERHDRVLAIKKARAEQRERDRHN